MIGRLWLALLASAVGVAAAPAEDAAALVVPANRVQAGDSAWATLATQLRDHAEVRAEFTEQRWFPFKVTPTQLRGEARLATGRGLSLHYVAPTAQTVIIDTKGVLVRTAAGDQPAPADSGANAANTALLQALHLDLAALAPNFELYGRRTATTWSLALVPRARALRNALGIISVDGEGATVRHLEFRRGPKQRVDIAIASPEADRPFTAEELREYFR